MQAIGWLCHPDEALPLSEWALNDADPTIRALAAKLLGNSETSHTQAIKDRLILLLSDSDPDVRFESARTLIRRKNFHGNSSFSVLFSFLDESETHPLMVAAVVNTLSAADVPEQTINIDMQPRLEKFLDHDRAEVREAVAIALAKWPVMAGKLTERLLPLLDDPEPIVREKIAQAFGRAGVVNDQIRSALELTSQDEDLEVAREAKDALDSLNRVSKF